MGIRKWLLEAPVIRNFAAAIVDKSIKENADFHYQAGLSPRIERRVGNNKACKWCLDKVGTYKYPDVPKEVFQRHRYCTCKVEYFPGNGKKQDVYTKRWGEETQNPENIIPKRLTQTSDRVKRILSEQLNKLTVEEVKILTRYTGNLAWQINSAISKGKIPERLAKEIKLLEKALSKGIVTDNIVVQRRISIQYALGTGVEIDIEKTDVRKMEGHIVTNNIFTSTALEPFEYDGRNAIISMKVPKGYRGALYIKNIALAKYRHQNEMLFNRGLQYRITHIEKIDGLYYIDAEVIMR